MSRVKQRLGVLEERVETLSGDQQQIRDEWDDVKQAPLINGRMLRSLRDTQLELSEILEKHSEILEKHSEILEKHSEILEKHSEILEKHSQKLDQLQGDVVELKVGQQTIVGMLTQLIDQDAEGNQPGD